MYLVHYVFAVWLQYALLNTELFVIGKAAIVFGGTFVMSWGITAALGGVPLIAQLIASKRGVRGT
jgi:predicted phage tail protein